MNDTLWQQLDRVGQRYARLRRGLALTAGGAVLTAAGGIVLVEAHRNGHAVSGGAIVTLLAGAAAVVVVSVTVIGRAPRAGWVARKLERRFPDLDTRLLTAVEQRPDPETGRLNYFQQRVVAEAVEHARANRWTDAIPPAAWRVTRVGQGIVAALFVLCVGVAAFSGPARHAPAVAMSVTSGLPKVEPGDTAVERGTGLIVLARYAGQLPGDVKLLVKSASGAVESSAMSRSLDDPVFAGRIANVQSDLQYAVVSGGDQSPWFTAKVFEYPDLKQADATLRYPAYTKLADRTMEDVRSVTAVEGATAVLRLKLNKPVPSAELLTADGPPILMTADPARPDVVVATIDLKKSQRLRVRLVDAEKRENKQPAAEIALNVNPNRPPELKPVTPGRDVDVSPIQELTVGVRASDDFGLIRVGLTYGLAGQATQDVVLAADVPGGQKRDVSQLLSMETMAAQPDQLLSYFFWAEDFAADGSVRRTQGDMYFAEVRPFEEIFRQGEQPNESEQRQQQQQQQQGGGNGQQAEELAESQKQIINATWKIIRRETSPALSPAFATDVDLVRQSQQSVRERLGQLAERVTDTKSLTFVKAVQEHADRAILLLEAAAKAGALPSLSQALSAEQSAYQALLKLRAREFEVVRGNRQQQQQGSQSASSSSSRRQQQLDQLQMDQEQNRYETQRSATPQADNPQQRETRQVLNRLKELAQRQEDLNRQMQELKSALDQAQTPQQREEAQRQLSRLRDQQAQQLRETDELRDRMDRPENQDSMADARQQLEQTRENVRRAGEALQQERVPDAAASGARAGEQLDKLRDQVRRESSGQLADAMTQLRDNARTLDEQQKQLSEQMKKLDETRTPGLRDGEDRQKLTQQVGRQREQLNKLTEATRKVVDEAETSEPLASKQLYDTLRQSAQQQTDQALDASRQLLDRGLTSAARQANAEADKGVAELRKGIEQAATNVLGDETEALRRASRELDRLAEDLQRDVDRNRPAGASTAGQPTTRPGPRALAGGPTTRPQSASAAANNGPATRPDQRLAEGGHRPSETTPTTGPAGALASAVGDGRDASRQPDRTGETGGLRGNRQPQQNAGDRQPGQQGGQQPGQQSDAQQSGQRGQEQQPGEPGQQPGQGEPSQSQIAQAGQGQRGQGQQPGQAGRGEQNGDRPTDAQARADGQNRQGQNNAGGTGGDRAGDPNARNNGLAGDSTDARDGPLTGDNFRDWSDRLRDVEEMISDPKLRGRAASIRDRARDVRAELKRHAQQPNWDMVQQTIGTPLAELRDQVAQEVARRQSPDALVPLDRETVPPQYAEQVRQYYERLGAGR